MTDAARLCGARLFYVSSFIALGPTDGTVHDEKTPRVDIEQAAEAPAPTRAETGNANPWMDEQPKVAEAVDEPEGIDETRFAVSFSKNMANLRKASDALEVQMERYGSHSDDASALYYRVLGELAKGGDEDAARKLEKAKSNLDTGGTVEDMDTKLMAMEALLNMDEERARPIIKSVMANQSPGTVKLREKAVFLLSQHDDRRHVAARDAAVPVGVLQREDQGRGPRRVGELPLQLRRGKPAHGQLEREGPVRRAPPAGIVPQPEASRTSVTPAGGGPSNRIAPSTPSAPRSPSLRRATIRSTCSPAAQ